MIGSVFVLKNLGSDDIGGAIRRVIPQFEEPGIAVIMVGDIMLGRTVNSTSLKAGDWNYPFVHVSEYLGTGDIVYANLENPIIEECPTSNTGTVFCAPPSALDGLKNYIDIVSLANNHANDYGGIGAVETEEHLREAGIGYTGRGALKIVEVGNTKFGFLGFNFFDKKLAEEDLELVRSSDGQVDVLFLGVHWGVEYTSEPTAQQRVWAKQLVMAGADVISGHHPHWVQSVEYINERPVYYSLGNFVFDQMWSEGTRRGLVVRLLFKDGEFVGEQRREIYMKNWAQPVFLE